MKNKKAQFKIQQMAFMLIALTVFFALVGIFVLSFNLSSLKNSANLLEQKNALLLVAKLANSPEFACGNSYGGGAGNCVDEDKIMMLKQDISKYRNFWGVYNIEIRVLSGENAGTEVGCTIANYPNCNTIKILENSSKGYDYSNFVSLCRKEASYSEGTAYDKCETAQLIVRYEKIQ